MELEINVLGTISLIYTLPRPMFEIKAGENPNGSFQGWAPSHTTKYLTREWVEETLSAKPSSLIW